MVSTVERYVQKPPKLDYCSCDWDFIWFSDAEKTGYIKLSIRKECAWIDNEIEINSGIVDFGCGNGDKLEWGEEKGLWRFSQGNC